MGHSQSASLASASLFRAMALRCERSSSPAYPTFYATPCLSRAILIVEDVSTSWPCIGSMRHSGSMAGLIG